MINAIKSLFTKKRNSKVQKKRSVVFYRHCYYHFYYLAQALRKREWDAIVVNLEPVNGSNANYYHGEDINLFDNNYTTFLKNIEEFLEEAKVRFRLMHFAGDGCLTFFPDYNALNNPPDIIQWKKLGNKVAYTISGCNSGVSQTSVSEWSKLDNGMNVCDRCIFQTNPLVCNDRKNLKWGKKISKYCDLIFAEISPALDYLKPGKNVLRGPVTSSMDTKFWSPNLQIPKEYLIEKEPEEIILYHAVGNYHIRHSDTRNIKGTPFIFKAVERLKSEGHKVRLIFVTDLPNTIVRYYQVQADIIVDQLNYGRYGANAREGMMLGKPVVCYMNKNEFRKKYQIACLEECPIVSASELTVYDELKKLIVNPGLRNRIGEQSRNYAVKWHDADACAERYEMIYDKLFAIN